MNDDPPPSGSVGDLPTQSGAPVPIDTLPYHDGVDTSNPPQGHRFHTPVFHRAGGMGRVFTAVDAEFTRTVALKDIHPRRSNNPQDREKFITEAVITGRLEHPGVAPVYSLLKPQSEDDKPFYAMRFIEGETLETLIRQFHSTPNLVALTSEQSIAIRRLFAHFLSICQTIAYAHHRGVLHRDLKPENIKIGSFGETVVLDWGLAVEKTAVVNEASAPKGTPAYWSPEQAEGRPHNQDERTDVYGLGAVLFVIVTGRSPHPLGTHREEPPSPKEQSPWVDDVLDSIVRKALAKRRVNRYQSAQELAEAVERWLADQPLASQREIVERMRAHLGLQGRTVVNEEQFARQLSNLGAIYQGMGRDVEATLALLEAATNFQSLFEHRSEPRFRAEKANCLVALATSYKRLGDFASERKAKDEAMLIYHGLVATNPRDYEPSLVSMIHRGDDIPAWSVPVPRIANDDKPVMEDLRTVDYQPDEIATGAAEGELKTGETRNVPSTDGTEDREITEGFTIITMLGEGGAGRVFLARDNVLGRKVAIKESASPNRSVAAQRFLREAQITANLSHPNIVQVYSHGRRSKTESPFIVREYIEGRDFYQIIFRDDPRDPALREAHVARCVRILAQVADALHYAHSKGIIHRDPKPMNVIVDAFDVPKVIDWGLAMIHGQEAWMEDLADRNGVPPEQFDLTRTGAIMGTPAYMSPEQARGDRERIGQSSDIYTLGVTLYEILTGENPIRSRQQPSAAIEMVLTGKFPKPRSIRSTVSKRLEAVCLRAMALAPEDRYPSAAEFAADLRTWSGAGTRKAGLGQAIRGLLINRE